MNYLRGAVNAISAPYQYYKELAPLNPSTLTGAIDVIVVSRPKQAQDEGGEANTGTSTDERELACSPFHVRFGKWQVLRPGDKKVNVFVNGKQIPFSMKIGDAGEAFFIFETDEDVPEDLVTSPLLEATKPGRSNARTQPSTGRFGAKNKPGDDEDQAQEPDFLDLNAAPQDTKAPPSGETPQFSEEDDIEDLEGDEGSSSILSRTAQVGKAILGIAHEAERAGKDKLKDESIRNKLMELEAEERRSLVDRVNAVRNAPASQNPHIGSQKGDEVLPSEESERIQPPDVRYGHDMVFDMEGYHSHSHVKDRSDDSVTTDATISAPQNTKNTVESSRPPSPEFSASDISSRPVPFPRATSEPPPEFGSNTHPAHMSSLRSTKGPTESLKLALPQSDEYSWEWGNFPQKTPVWDTFGKAGSKTRGPLTPDEYPPTQLPESIYGSGGRLTIDRRDPTRFRVYIEGRTMEFELSLIPSKTIDDYTGTHPGHLGWENEVEDARRFEEGKVDFSKFLTDDSIVRSEDLVLRWAGEQYITRKDKSPLMDALLLWREAALNQTSHLSSRSTSPMSDTERRARRQSIDDEDGFSSSDERPNISRAVTAEQGQPQKKPSSSSWVRWWSRSRQAEADRPNLKPTSSEPSQFLLEGRMSLPAPKIRPTISGSAPALPSTPVKTLTPSQSTTTLEVPGDEKAPRKRFAKTLRLTSDQLKSLDLKPGANTITFSLSASGAAACTARIFVWDYTDLIVVSDIDGTITKSDALGHVFTLIGRDWTHLGVAKLYTDICRNGYKIMYLTSRAIGQADSTRDYLKGIKQNDYQLPEGPVIMSPDRLIASLHREVIMRKPEVFKMACLRDIQRLFGRNGDPFYAGFGNRITDALSYRSVNVPSSRIFTIDSSGEVKMELLELAGYKSSYIHMTDLVDQMFPPIHRMWEAEYTDFNFWKTPMQEFALPDLAPPSPALSARSDTSNQSTLARLRNFSLVSRQASASSRLSLPPPAVGSVPENPSLRPRGGKDGHLRQMSSLERLSSTLAGLASSSSTAASSPRTTSPTFLDSEDSDDEEAGRVDLEKGQQRRPRARSVSSMPGSLPGSSSSDEEYEFDVDDGEHSGGEYDGDHDDYNDEHMDEETFDENLFATGEMENVPFL